jgi:hypothetical protein
MNPNSQNNPNQQQKPGADQYSQEKNKQFGQQTKAEEKDESKDSKDKSSCG